MDKCIACGICVRTCSQQAIYSARFQRRGMDTPMAPWTGA